MASQVFKSHASQVSMSCRICKGSKHLKWFCKDCEIDSNCEKSSKFIICTSCKIRHGQIPATANHLILSFNDIDSCTYDALTKSKIRRTPCRKHPDDTYTLFCQICNILVCASCIPKYHNGHIMRGIDNFVEEKLRREGKELSKRLPTRRSPSEDEVCKQKYQLCQEQVGKFPSSTSTSSSNKYDYFLLQSGFRVISSATAKLPCVYFMKVLSDDTAWIGLPKWDKIIKVKIKIPNTFFQSIITKAQLDIDLESRQVDEIMGINATDIEILSNGNILCVSGHNYNINMVTECTNGRKQISQFSNLEPLIPISIHAEKDGEQLIWVGAKEIGEEYHLTLHSVRQVIALSQSGRAVKIIEKTVNERRLFTVPWRLIRVADYLCVIDTTTTVSGRVISLKTSGHLMWIYNTKQSGICSKEFYPTSMRTTASSQNILVMDAANSSLHVLDMHGSLLLQQSMKTIKVQRPFSIDTDETGQIWVGCVHDKSVSPVKSKIYILKIIGL